MTFRKKIIVDVSVTLKQKKMNFGLYDFPNAATKWRIMDLGKPINFVNYTLFGQDDFKKKCCLVLSQ